MKIISINERLIVEGQRTESEISIIVWRDRFLYVGTQVG